MVDFDYRVRKRPLDKAVQRQARYFRDIPELGVLLDVLPQFLLIINDRRQIVFANRHVSETLQLRSIEDIYGLAPGELLDCPNAVADGGGCGQTEACESCGANRSISMCRDGGRPVQECRILQKHSGRALDLRVSGTPVYVQGEQFTVLALTDISHEKRRQTLERIFFHDLMNLATGIAAYSALLSRRPNPEHAAEASNAIRKLVSQLADEINAQRELAEAEADELKVAVSPLGSLDMLSTTVEIYREHEAARDRALSVDADAADVKFPSDRLLLMRVLGNMVKNALEACHAGGQVSIGCTPSDDHVRFWVHNPGPMPRDVQLQVFQRSFSTKGRGRGLGTYSIKLLTERYLGGVVGFTTSAKAGTVFFVDLPRA